MPLLRAVSAEHTRMLMRGVVVLVDCIVVSGAVSLAYLIRFDFDIWPYYQDQLLNMLAVIVMMRISALYFLGGYQFYWRYCGIKDLFAVMRAIAFGTIAIISVDYLRDYGWATLCSVGVFLAAVFHRLSREAPNLSNHGRVALSLFVAACVSGLAGAVFLFTSTEGAPSNISETALGAVLNVHLVPHELGIPRAVMLLESILAFLGICSVRLGPRVLGDLRGQVQVGARPVVIYGVGDFGESVARHLGMAPDSYKVVGFIDDDRATHHRNIRGLPIIGGSEDLPGILEKYTVKEVLIAVDDPLGVQLAKVAAACRSKGVAVRRMPKISAYLSGRIDEQSDEMDESHLLGREEVYLDPEEIEGYLRGNVTLVTGAGGSIGSEICHQIAGFAPGRIVLLGKGEASLHSLVQDLAVAYPRLQVKTVIADIRNQRKLDRVLEKYKPQIVFHAAAHKHVPFMEQDPDEAISTIFLGTRAIARSAMRNGVDRFVLISTDKAVHPVSVMGAAKRLAEMELSNVATVSQKARFVSVRFGNVLGSRGSVTPIFERQIREGGPVTVTHPEMCRYFMTIPEAVRLVLHSAAVAENGELCVLDMGKPVRILELAENMIRLAGFEPYTEIPIKFTGIRPGEKLTEELIEDDQATVLRKRGKIAICANLSTVAQEKWDEVVSEFRRASDDCDTQLIRELLAKYIPAFGGDEARKPSSGQIDSLL